MKHQAINLVKFKALSKRLGLPLCWTVGILESLWLFACHNARDGDLSRFSDLELAGWAEYPGNEKELIDALVETGWLDRDGDNLLIHDWNEHKPNWLKGIQGRSEKEKPSREPSCVPSPEPSSTPSKEPSTVLPIPKPNLTKPEPNETQPNETTPSPDPDPVTWQAVVQKCLELGMSQPESACEAAKNRGCIANEAMCQVKYFADRPGAWGVGLLYKIIECLRPEKRVLWPEPSEAYKKILAAEQQKQTIAKAATTRKKQKNERAENEQRAAELEANFGAQLDAMSKDEIREVVREKFTVLLPMLNGTPCTGLIRKSMLGHLESVAKRPALSFSTQTN